LFTSVPIVAGHEFCLATIHSVTKRRYSHLLGCVWSCDYVISWLVRCFVWTSRAAATTSILLRWHFTFGFGRM